MICELGCLRETMICALGYLREEHDPRKGAKSREGRKRL
jgi:hypothetical protein